MFCTNCGKEVTEKVEKCPNCGNVLTPKEAKTVKEKKTLGSKIKAIGNTLGCILIVLYLLDMGFGLVQGKSLNDIAFNSEHKHNPEENDRYTYKSNVIDIYDNEYNTDTVDNAEKENSTVETVSPDTSTSREMIMTAEDWEGVYRRYDGMMLSLYKNDDNSLIIHIGDESGTWVYIRDELASLSESGASVIYDDSDFKLVINYSTEYGTCTITQMNKNNYDGENLAGSYYYQAY